ncbi:MAG TPA: hypothetical protein VH593_21600 [Ktedonobacteraceae bacterium]|jgi:hypothetical protein
MSTIQVNARIVPFGQATVTFGPATVQPEPGVQKPGKKAIHYQEPTETASFSYELLYESQQSTDVIHLYFEPLHY